MAKNFSTFSIAELLHVDPGSVANWIDQNLLKAHRTPGGHRRVSLDDLLVFLRQHHMPIPPELEQNRKILVVDDDPAITKLIVATIQTANPSWQLFEAHDGFRAGAMVATLRPDVVILDLKMPGIDGYEVCRLIKSQQNSHHIHVLAMTAYFTPENEKQIKDCGARACFSKPLEMNLLLKELEAIA